MSARDLVEGEAIDDDDEEELVDDYEGEPGEGAPIKRREQYNDSSEEEEDDDDEEAERAVCSHISTDL